ncbi:MAG: restriction endonuclease subunit S [Gemmatimonadetes bacterium]|nr:restriction endonuclease subunit S [Gemmatimonadota bacterium]
MRARAYKPYSAYKDSGVEWLGEIPAGWEVKRLRFVSDSNPVPSEVRSLPGDSEVSFVPMEAVGKNGGLALETTKLLADVKAGYSYFRDGDVVIAKITPCFENGKGALAEGLTNGIAFGTTELHVLRARHTADRRFAFYVTLSDAFRRLGEADMYGAGGQKRISESFVRNFPIALPSLPEQRAIATFLDRETARIDALVAKKERLITLLQERRTALITRAVTKGLDPTAAMKDSGVEWLGEIPAHWEVRPLRTTIASCLNGVWGDDPDGVSDVVCVRVADFDRVRLGVDITEPTVRAIEPRVVAERGLRSGDLLLEKSGGGENQPVGAVVLYTHPVPAVCSNFVARVVVSATSDPKYLVYLHKALYSMRINTKHIKQSTGIQNLDSRSYFGETVGIPLLAEQKEIAGYLAAETARIDALSARIRAAITRVQELRTALIAAAVTGKIDVRDHESSGGRQT